MREGVGLDRNFRAAFNGFNRSDVVNYIEECSVHHERTLRQLRDENTKLRADLEALQAERDALAAALPPAAPEPEAGAAPDTAEETAACEAAPAPSELELAAYRRAEAVERSARQRAAGLCRQVNEIVETAVRQFDSSSADVTALMSDLNICLRRLNDTFAELRLSFDDTASAFSAVNILSEDG